MPGGVVAAQWTLAPLTEVRILAGQPQPAVKRRLMLEYKGYIGEVVYDDEAEVLHARVINSDSYPIANAEATDVEGIEREFRASTDVYLDGCAELGRTRRACRFDHDGGNERLIAPCSRRGRGSW